MSIKSFVTSLSQTVIAGVVRQYTYPPVQISTADLPASFVRPPQSQYDPMSVCDDVDDRILCDLVVVTEAAGQNWQPTNYDTILDIADTVNVALKNSNFGAIVTWTIVAQDAQPIIVGGTPYWGITAKVIKRG